MHDEAQSKGPTKTADDLNDLLRGGYTWDTGQDPAA